MLEKEEPPKVFISYSWTNEDHIDWVVELATRLCNDGVNVILDHWDLVEGHDKFAFMERMVTDTSVSKVLVICDRVYSEKADGRLGGVGTETLIISPEVYGKVSQEKFIPIIRERDEEGKEYVPTYLRARKYIDFCDPDSFEQAYDKLLRNIFRRPEKKKPTLGNPPAHLFAEDSPILKTAGKLRRLKDAVLRGKAHVQVMLDEYLDCFLECLEDFHIQDSGQLSNVGNLVLQNVATFLPFRDDFLDFLDFVTAYVNDKATYDSLFDFLEKLLPHRSWPENRGSWSECLGDNFAFLNYELFLYFIAILIHHKRYTAAATFIESRYHFAKRMAEPN